MEIGDLNLKSCGNVYAPREDSYMLANAVNMHAFGKVLDLGTGSGIQGIVAALNGCDVTFSDIDDEAIRCAKQNAKLNNVDGKFVCSDMFGRISGKFNTIIFNPPYVTSGKRRHIALDGGRMGRHYIEEFINSYSRHILERHAILLLESSFNMYEKDLKTLKARIVSKEHYFFEDLVVLLF